MNRATPLLRDFVERLIAHETQRTTPAGTENPVAFRLCEELHPHLATLMGRVGFYALFSRALALAAAEAPELCAVQVQPDGSLVQDGPAAGLTAGSVALLTRLLGLLEAFIGQKLTLRLLREVWPNVPLSALHFTTDNHK